MNTPTDRLIFFGTDQFSVPTLQALLEAGFKVVGVVTRPDALVGRGRKLTPPPVKELAQRHHIPVLQPLKLAEAEDQIAKLKPDAGVVVAYGRIIPPSIMSRFAKGIINIHGSLLPKYRGASPIEATILNGDSVAGVSLIKINERMDAGEVYALCPIQLTGRETRPQLYDALSQFGARQLVAHLPSILGGRLSGKPQDDSQASYVSLITKEAGQLDLSKPAIQLEREVRAYLGWPGSRTTLASTEVTITAAHVASEAPAKELAIATSQGYLVIDQLKPAGKREMTGREFLAGHHHRS